MEKRASLRLRATAGLAAFAALSGCGIMPDMRGGIETFDTGVHTAVNAQTALYANGRKLECDADFYSAAVDWAGLGTTALPDLAACTPAVMDDATLAKRRALLDALTLYADKLQALAGPKDDSKLGDDGKALATHLNAAAAAMHPGLPSGVAGGVEAAVIRLTSFVLDQVRFRDAKAAAAQLDLQVALVVDTLEAENREYGATLKSATVRIQVAMNTALTREKARGTPSFAQAAVARTMLRDASVFGPVRPADLAGGTDLPAVQALNAALDRVKKANHEIATAPKAQAAAAAKELVAQAQQANADRAALSQ